MFSRVEGGLLSPLSLTFLICKVGTVTPRQGCRDEAQGAHCGPGWAAGGCESLGGRHWPVPQHKLGVGRCGSDLGESGYFSNPFPCFPSLPPAAPSLGHILVGLCGALGFIIVVYLLVNCQYLGPW